MNAKNALNCEGVKEILQKQNIPNSSTRNNKICNTKFRKISQVHIRSRLEIRHQRNPIRTPHIHMSTIRNRNTNSFLDNLFIFKQTLPKPRGSGGRICLQKRIIILKILAFENINPRSSIINSKFLAQPC